MSKKLTLIERPYGNKRFVVYYGKEKLAQFTTKSSANEFASMYLVPPYTMQSNVWYSQ